MHVPDVPDVTDVNGGRMKAEWFPCLTEHLISLFLVFGRKAEGGAGKYLSAATSVAMMMIILMTFICRGLFDVCVLVHRCPAYINSAFTHIPIPLQISSLCLAQGHLGHSSEAQEVQCRLWTTPLGKWFYCKTKSLIWSVLWLKNHHYSAQCSFLCPLAVQCLVTVFILCVGGWDIN